jgi:hypothetical protein
MCIETPTHGVRNSSGATHSGMANNRLFWFIFYKHVTPTALETAILILSERILVMPPRWGWDVVFGSFLQICRAYGAFGSAKMRTAALEMSKLQTPEVRVCTPIEWELDYRKGSVGEAVRQRIPEVFCSAITLKTICCSQLMLPRVCVRLWAGRALTSSNVHSRPLPWSWLEHESVFDTTR